MSLKDFRLSLTSRDQFNVKVDNLLRKNPNRVYTVTIKRYVKSKKRSLPSNDHQHVWYEQISKYHGDRLYIEVKCECKIILGLPIILESEEWGQRYEEILHKHEFYQKTYEEKIKWIRDLPITSYFTPAESKIYMDNMIYYYNEAGIPIKYSRE